MTITEGMMDFAVKVGLSLDGTKEVGQNRGGMVDAIQKEFGFKGVQYCVLTTLYCYKKACEYFGVDYYLPKTASSQTLFEEAKKYTSTDFSKIQPGDIVIWRKFKLWQGHAGLCISLFDMESNSFRTIEGNTSPDKNGNQREGDGIYQKLRYARKMDFTVDNFYLRGYINMTEYLNDLGYAVQIIGR